MRTPLGFRRFPSSHPSSFSIFSGIFENIMRGERGGGLNRVGMPCRPLGGPAPAPFSSLPPVARRGRPVPGRPGNGWQWCIFAIYPNRHIFLNFFKYRNEKKTRGSPAG